MYMYISHISVCAIYDNLFTDKQTLESIQNCNPGKPHLGFLHVCTCTCSTLHVIIILNYTCTCTCTMSVIIMYIH